MLPLAQRSVCVDRDHGGDVRESRLCPSNLETGSGATFNPVLKDIEGILETLDGSTRNLDVGIECSQLKVSLCNF